MEPEQSICYNNSNSIRFTESNSCMNMYEAEGNVHQICLGKLLEAYNESAALVLLWTTPRQLSFHWFLAFQKLDKNKKEAKKKFEPRNMNWTRDNRVVNIKNNECVTRERGMNYCESSSITVIQEQAQKLEREKQWNGWLAVGEHPELPSGLSLAYSRL